VFWLYGWLAGEVFALSTVLSMLHGAVLPAPIAERLPDTSNGGGPFVVVFLLVWLTFWTFGGIFAFRQLLTLLWGREEISAGPEGIRVRRGAGPFLWDKKISRRKIESIRMRRLSGPIKVETSDGVVRIASLGTREERQTLRDRLRESLQMEAPVSLADGVEIRIPGVWEKAVDVTGAPVLRRSRALQAKAARVAWVTASIAGFSCVFVISRLLPPSGDSDPTALVFVTGGFTLLAAIGGVLFTWGRHEFVAHYRKLEVRRGVGSFLKAKTYAEPDLVIKTRTDSDGDEFMSLVVREGEGEQALVSTLNEAHEPVIIGRGLAREMCTELTIPPEVRAVLAA
jgi:hypothetical protein